MSLKDKLLKAGKEDQTVIANESLNLNEEEIAKEFKDANLITYMESEKGSKKKKLKLEIKHPGAFTEWCKEQGFEGVTCECICKAMKTDDPVLHKRANFAYNFGWRRNGKTCACMEAIRLKNQKKNQK